MRRPLAGAIVVAAAMAGCGGGATPTPQPDRVVDIRIDDYRLHPQAVRVPRGRITFRVTNAGRVPHGFAIRGDGGAVRLQMSTMLPGETTVETVRIRRPDTYRMFDPSGNHEELGEHGRLVVVR